MSSRYLYNKSIGCHNVTGMTEGLKGQGVRFQSKIHVILSVFRFCAGRYRSRVALRKWQTSYTEKSDEEKIKTI